MNKSLCRLFAVLTLCLLLVLSLVTAGSASANVDNYVSVLVGFNDIKDGNLIKNLGGQIKHNYKNLNLIAANIPYSAIDKLKGNNKVKYMELDRKAKAFGEVLPWGVDRVDADLVQPTYKGLGVKVAIIDTGIDYTHPDLTSKVAGGYNFVSGNTNYLDDNGHGTHVAGTVAAVDNEIGVIGIAPDAELYAVKVLDSTGSGYYSDIIAGIDWAISNNMQIINMSIGGTYDSLSLKDACDRAFAQGILLVAAAGNDSAGVSYPAKYDSVLAVSAIDEYNSLAYFSNTGPEVDLTAPGVNILSTYLGGYAYADGTSMASPHVAGVASLLLSANPQLTNLELKQTLQQSAVDLGPTGFDNLFGFGLVNAARAINLAQLPVTVPALQVTVTTDKLTYLINNRVFITVNAKDSNGNIVAGAAATVTVTTPTGKVSTFSGTTDSNGNFAVTYKTTKSTGKGVYVINAAIDKSGYSSGNGSSSFSVN